MSRAAAQPYAPNRHTRTLMPRCAPPTRASGGSTPDMAQSMRLTKPDPDAPDTLLPLTDYEEVTLPQMHGLLRSIYSDDESATVAEATILRQLDATFDHAGTGVRWSRRSAARCPSRDPATGKIR